MRPSPIAFLLAVALSSQASAQLSTTPQQGLAEHTPRHASIVNARIVVAPGREIASGSLELRDGLVLAVRSGRHEAAGSLVIDAAGKTLYPAFIDAHGAYGLDSSARCREASRPAAAAAGGRRAMMMGAAASTPVAPAAQHWNDRVCPERDIAAALALDAERAKTLRRLGFAASLASPGSGVLRGQSALLSLRDQPSPQQNLLAARVAQHAAFEADFAFGGVYPGSKMGAIALIRQALIDARWQRDSLAWSARQGGQRAEANAALDALAPVLDGAQPLVFRADDELDVLRAARLVEEFGLKQALVLGNGAEYRIVEQLPAGLGLLLPLNFPAAPQAEDAESALELTLAELEHWRQAPLNPAVLAKAGHRFALTLHGLEKPEEAFWPALRKAIRHGLDEARALEALTTRPAAFLGQSARIGSLEPGRMANLLIADAGLFREDAAKIYEVWVDGSRDIVQALDAPTIGGRWALDWQGADGPAEWTIEGSPASLKLKIGEDEAQGKLVDGRLLLTLPAKLLGGPDADKLSLEAHLSRDRLDGRWMLVDGRVRSWSATRLGEAAAEESADAPAREREPAKTAAAVEPLPERWRYPAGEFGREALPPAPSALVIRAATVWMTGADAPLADTDVLIERGRIRAVGTALRAPAGAIEIEGRGRHLTPGLIDAHSHIAISGNVNEPSHAITAEVRIGDVIDPTDINIYRELAGGTTSSHLLHGSANPIGGQSQLIKHRWGAHAEALKFEGWMPTIKFALGENVKQSNWPGGGNRYPQTRMGVEQILLDAFEQARAYAAARARKGGAPQRRDLRMETLAEILAGQRLVHIHSYRQDEILMFVRLSERLGFPVAAFQHVLEGYKVAEALAAAQSGASTFADWWGFKMETYDAIPYNPAIMHAQGVLVSLNSDSNDLGRRLNTEAAKAVKYGGLSETEALAMVTRNPARQLRIDDRVGSIAPGLDADLVLWSHHPLSSYARPEKVWIDGREYFDRAADAAEQQRIDRERERLIQLARAEAPKGGPGGGPGGPGRRPRLLVDPGHYAVLSAGMAARRGIYHHGEAVHHCQAEF